MILFSRLMSLRSFKEYVALFVSQQGYRRRREEETGGLPQCSNDCSLIFCSESSSPCRLLFPHSFLLFFCFYPSHFLPIDSGGFDIPAYFIERPLLILSALINRSNVWKSSLSSCLTLTKFGKSFSLSKTLLLTFLKAQPQCTLSF